MCPANIDKKQKLGLYVGWAGMILGFFGQNPWALIGENHNPKLLEKPNNPNFIGLGWFDLDCRVVNFNFKFFPVYCSFTC